MTNCPSQNTLGSQCAKKAGHRGKHKSMYGATWTDESNYRAIQEILAESKRWTRD